MVRLGPISGSFDLAGFVGMNHDWEFTANVWKHRFPRGDLFGRGNRAFGRGVFGFGVGFRLFEEIFCGAQFGAAVGSLFLRGLGFAAPAPTFTAGGFEFPNWPAEMQG